MIINGNYVNERVKCSKNSKANVGKVIWSPTKSIWISSMYLTSLIGGYLFFSISGIILFVLFTLFTLCMGHSLGMHRRFIHHSYQCPKWLEYFLVHLGVIVGIAGPFGMMRAHDMRDWAQRQQKCHDFFGQQQTMFIDWFWQLHCEIQLEDSPEFCPEKNIEQDKVYQWMEKTWMLQQLPWALLFFSFGGMSWVVWGICARVAASVTGHWLIGYFAHNQGHQDWLVSNASIQGFNIPLISWITMGENWHNNHHAFPGSANLGLHSSQADPGWKVLKILEKLGLAWDLKQPDDLPKRDELIRLVTGKPYKCRLLTLIH